MSEISEERVEALASNILECHDVKPSEVKALAGLALLALRERAEPDQHEAHIRREVNVGGNTWVQCSKQAFEREKARGALCRVLYESPPALVADGWIACSERMPEVGDIVLTADNGCVNVGEMERSGSSCRYFTSVVSGRELPATHWMPLPEAPGKEG